MAISGEDSRKKKASPHFKKIVGTPQEVSTPAVSNPTLLIAIQQSLIRVRGGDQLRGYGPRAEKRFPALLDRLAEEVGYACRAVGGIVTGIERGEMRSPAGRDVSNSDVATFRLTGG